MMRAEYERLIAGVDTQLGLLRVLWLAARDSFDRAMWMGSINNALDERLRLMRCREAAAS